MVCVADSCAVDGCLECSGAPVVTEGEEGEEIVTQECAFCKNGFSKDGDGACTVCYITAEGTF